MVHVTTGGFEMEKAKKLMRIDSRRYKGRRPSMWQPTSKEEKQPQAMEPLILYQEETNQRIYEVAGESELNSK